MLFNQIVVSNLNVVKCTITTAKRPAHQQDIVCLDKWTHLFRISFPCSLYCSHSCSFHLCWRSFPGRNHWWSRLHTRWNLGNKHNERRQQLPLVIRTTYHLSFIAFFFIFEEPLSSQQQKKKEKKKTKSWAHEHVPKIVLPTPLLSTIALSSIVT